MTVQTNMKDLILLTFRKVDRYQTFWKLTKYVIEGTLDVPVSDSIVYFQNEVDSQLKVKYLMCILLPIFQDLDLFELTKEMSNHLIYEYCLRACASIAW